MRVSVTKTVFWLSLVGLMGCSNVQVTTSGIEVVEEEKEDVNTVAGVESQQSYNNALDLSFESSGADDDGTTWTEHSYPISKELYDRVTSNNKYVGESLNFPDRNMKQGDLICRDLQSSLFMSLWPTKNGDIITGGTIRCRSFN